MLGKLLKYEFKSTARIFLPMYILTIVLSLISRIFITFEDTNITLKVIASISTILFGFSLILMLATAFIVVIQRFYKNLLRDEGYLSFTLPVTPCQHIVSKLISASIWLIISFIIFIFSIAIIITDKIFIDNIVQFFNDLIANTNIDIVFLIFESIIIAITSMLVFLLMTYASMAVGQLIKGHKIIGSIAAYFGFYTAVQIIMAVLLLIISLINPYIIYDSRSIFISIIIFVQIILITVFFTITNYILTKKLNLE